MMLELKGGGQASRKAEGQPFQELNFSLRINKVIMIILEYCLLLCYQALVCCY